METSCAALTVNVVAPETDPEVAVMFAVPVPTPLANPVLSMVAVPGVSEVQVTVAVMSCRLLSLNVP